MARFCANCGTEVDDNAVFCPTCGQPIDQDVEAEMPAAPAWPEAERAPAAEPAEPAERDAVREPAPRRPDLLDDDDESRAPAPFAEEPTRLESRVPETDRPAEAPPPRSPAREGAPPVDGPGGRAGPAIDLPLTMPVTLSAWLIGGGAVLGGLGALVALFDGIGTIIDALLLAGLLAVAATVFAATHLPAVKHLRLATLAVVLVAFGVALDRLGFGVAGIGELLLFLGTAAAAIGALILELGRDQPLGRPQS
jgi:hypothetical protein